MQLLFNRVNQYGCSLYETARGVLRSRNRQAQRNQELTLQIRELQLRVEQLANESQDHQKRVAETQHDLALSEPQQTELGHFTPPPQKPKARFMNLGPSSGSQ